MKNIFKQISLALTIVSMLMPGFLFSQDGPYTFKKYVMKQDTIIEKDTLLITKRGFNYLVADKLTTFLASDRDISLNKSYATISTDDETFNFGYNFKNETENGQRVKWIFAPGLKMDFKDGLAPVFSSGKYNDNISGTLKLTHFGKGKLYYNGEKNQKQIDYQGLVGPKIEVNQKSEMKIQRDLIASGLFNKYVSEMKAFEKDLDSLVTNEIIQDTLRNEFYKSRLKKYKDEFHKKEAEILKEKGHYNLLRMWWQSVGLTLPFNKTTYYVVDKPADFFGEKQNYNLSAYYQLNVVFESKKYGRFFISGGVTVKNNSSILTKQMEEVDKQELKKIISNDSTTIYQSTVDKAYLGQFKTFTTTALNFQFVYYFPKLEEVGFRFSVEKYTNSYNPLNLTFGVPLNLKGKDEEKHVTIEPQIKLFDAYNSLKSDGNTTNRISLGIKVGLPFSSIIY